VVISAVMGEGWKPLTIIQVATLSSQARTGAAAATPGTDRSSYSPKRTAVPDAKMSVPPTKPRTAMTRGTSPERYIRYASSTVFTPSASFGPKTNVQLWTATSDWPTVTAAAASPPVVPVMVHRGHGEQADRAHGDDRRLDEAPRHMTEGHAFVLSPNDRIQGDGSAHDGDGQQHLEEGSDQDAGVVHRRRHDEVGRTENGTVGEHPGNGRDLGDQEEDAGDDGGLSG
jgi:hypothetical protein